MPRHARASARGRALGANVRAVREKKGLSQQRLAEQMGPQWSQQVIARLEAGLVGMRVEQLLDLEAALGTNMARLFRGVREAKD